eukprot:GFKZ01015997.1.p1 GENE.GFKZ01015997.1~~GFKZ01015997.1.p1  ORF type:complete len:227 (-),score=37.70 GFKZ01015997.1:1579-2259(-)
MMPQSPLFIPALPLRSRLLIHHSISRVTSRYHVALNPSKTFQAPRLSGKGFGKAPPPPKKPKEPLKPGIDSSYIPRGPTLRAEYERRGIIEPEMGPDAGVLPEVVANRMLRRILTFGAVPLGLLFVFFIVYFVLKYKYDITVIPVVVAYSTLGAVGLGTLGITYGIFSSSWDEDDEGSALGWVEMRKNVVRARDGLFGAREKEKREEEFAKLDELNEYRRKKGKDD